MKKLLTLLLASCSFILAYSQTISNVNFDQIKADITASGQWNYGRLTERFRAKDTTLTADDYKHLYYGQVFQSFYSPYNISANEAMKALQQNDLAKAEQLTDATLAANPVNLDALYNKSYLLLKQGKRDEMMWYVKQFRGLLFAIMGSGDGKTEKTAMVVANVSDEYQVLKAYKAKLVKQALVSECDRMTVQRTDQPDQSDIYFNVQKPLASMAKAMKQ